MTEHVHAWGTDLNGVICCTMCGARYGVWEGRERRLHSSDFGRGGAAIEAAAANDRIAALESALEAAEREREELRAERDELTAERHRLHDALEQANGFTASEMVARQAAEASRDAAQAALVGLREWVEEQRQRHQWWSAYAVFGEVLRHLSAPAADAKETR